MDDDLRLSARDLMSFVSPEEAAQRRGTSIRTTEEELIDFFVWLSPRRKGIRLHIVLGLPAPALPALEDGPPPGGRLGPSPAGVAPRGVAALRQGWPRGARKRLPKPPKAVPILEKG